MLKERQSRQGISRTEYVYDTDSSNRPILEITKSIDTNFDGSPDSETQNSIFRTLNRRHTSMMDHVAELQDILAQEINSDQGTSDKRRNANQSFIAL